MIEDPTELIETIRNTLKAGAPPPALVFNCHITGLAVARSLSRQGVPVIGLDRDANGYGLHSRHVKVAGRCSYPLDDEGGFINLLLEIGRVLPARGVLFPCLDEWVFAVSRHRAELQEFYDLPFSDPDTINRILDKDLLYRKCEESGIPIPKTFYLTEQKPEDIAAKIEFPCIVKPSLQREFTNEFGEKVFRAENRAHFLEMCERAAHHPLLVQEIVGSGTDSFYSVCSYLDREGQARGVFVGRKLEQYPPDFGTACLVDSKYVDSIAARGVDILRQFGYHGISEVEYIFDDRDKEYKLLDINTRVWKWIGLPMAAGVDLPWLAYKDITGSPAEPAIRQKDGLKWVYLKDYYALRRERGGAPEATLSLQDWRDLIGGNLEGSIVDAVFSQDDPGPFARLIESTLESRQYYCAC
ncbi:MAG TPA: carboxylate--amine ligase [Blastocatellia bacterium]